MMILNIILFAVLGFATLVTVWRTLLEFIEHGLDVAGMWAVFAGVTLTVFTVFVTIHP